MARPTVELDLAVADVARDLRAGGVFVIGCALPFDAECMLVVRGHGGVLEVSARVVFVDGARGAGLQIVGFTAEIKARILALHVEPDPAEPEAEAEAQARTDADRKVAKTLVDSAPPSGGAEARGQAANLHERLRNLTMAEQMKIARAGEPQERIILERIYGKTVWEALLHNPRLTAPEVARLARLATLPRVLIELIVNNGAWLQIPEVRRALLANGKLGVDQIMRVLRMLPKHELRLAATQTAYSYAVRDAARKLVRD